MKNSEFILAVIFLLSGVIRDLTGDIWIANITMILGSFLGVIYLIGNYWIDKPHSINIRTVSISILYGIVSWGLTFSVLFKLLYLSGSDELSLLSIIFLILVITVDLLTSYKKIKVISPWTTWRLIILSSLTILFLLIPQDLRISITYRKHPGFLEFYHENKDSKEFYLLEKEYFNPE